MQVPNFRVGLGYDTHRIGPGGPLRLGGIDIPWEYELIGHSDADVLLHAITDAVLGGCGAGDIGRLFPNNASENKGRDSGEMLAIAMQQVRDAGWEIVNLDCVVLAQQPKLAPYAGAMCQRIAEVLNIEASEVSVKGKTGEHVGPVGRMEAIDARCCALLFRP